MVPTLTLVAFTFFGVAYPWLLPALAETGFAQPGAKSISGFIETPAATGGMAVATAGPIWLMGKLEMYLNNLNSDRLSWSQLVFRRLSFYLFLIGFGGFLIFNKTDYKMAHYAFVFIFSIFFFVHAVFRYSDLHSTAAQIVLILGILAFVGMAIMIAADVDTLWFWATECIGFSMLLLFTPIELQKLKSKSSSTNVMFVT